MVGIGAINHDHVATTEQVSAIEAREVEGWFSRVQTDREEAAQQAEIVESIRRLDQRLERGLQHAIGGSALNALSVLGSLNLGLRLGFVGVAGRLEHPSLSIDRHLSQHNIDSRWVAEEPESQSGLSLSVMWKGDRVLNTSIGANALMARHLRENSDELASELSDARLVHISSLLDPESQTALAALVEEVRDRKDRPALSIDPGSVWVRNPPEAVQRILACADYLLLNELEFYALGDHRIADRDLDVARRILDKCGGEAVVLLLKRSGSSSVFFAGPDEKLEQLEFPHAPIAATEIEDATGAGDYFAAGVLGLIASVPIQAALGARLGAALARSKLHGETERSQLGTVFDRFVSAEDAFANLDPNQAANQVGDQGAPILAASSSALSETQSGSYPRWAGPLETLLEIPSLLGSEDASTVAEAGWSTRTKANLRVSDLRELPASDIGAIERIKMHTQADGISILVEGDSADLHGLRFEVSGTDANLVTGVATRISERLNAEARAPQFPIRATGSYWVLPLGVLLEYLTPRLEILPPDTHTRWRRFWGPLTFFGVVGLILAIVAIVVAI